MRIDATGLVKVLQVTAVVKLVEQILVAVVDEPEKVHIHSALEEDGTLNVTISVAAEDQGKVIGKQGRIAKSLRTIVYANAHKMGLIVKIAIKEQPRKDAGGAALAAQARGQ